MFIKGQNVSQELEIDGLDDESEHVIARLDEKPIGCARIRYVDGKAKLERIAILEQYRGKGYGKKLMEFLVDYCRKKDVSGITMNAQYYLLDFYKSLGFEPVGEKFLEAGIEHIEMSFRVDA